MLSVPVEPAAGQSVRSQIEEDAVKQNDWCVRTLSLGQVQRVREAQGEEQRHTRTHARTHAHIHTHAKAYS